MPSVLLHIPEIRTLFAIIKGNVLHLFKIYKKGDLVNCAMVITFKILNTLLKGLKINIDNF